MTSHSSASMREHTPHANQTTRTATVINALKRRAQAVLNDESIDPESRAIIRYGLETNDPWLAELVRRAGAGERIIDADGSVADTFGSSQMQETSADNPATATGKGTQTTKIHEPDSSRERSEALADIICGAGECATRADGADGELGPSSRDCEHGETLCFYSLR